MHTQFSADARAQVAELTEKYTYDKIQNTEEVIPHTFNTLSHFLCLHWYFGMATMVYYITASNRKILYTILHKQPRILATVFIHFKKHVLDGFLTTQLRGMVTDGESVNHHTQDEHCILKSAMTSKSHQAAIQLIDLSKWPTENRIMSTTNRVARWGGGLYRTIPKPSWGA